MDRIVIMYKKRGNISACFLKKEKSVPEYGIQKQTWGSNDPHQAAIFGSPSEAMEFATPILGERDAVEWFRAIPWDEIPKSWFATMGGDGYRKQ